MREGMKPIPFPHPLSQQSRTGKLLVTLALGLAGGPLLANWNPAPLIVHEWGVKQAKIA